MNRERDLLKNTLILSIGTFLPKFVSLITLPILTACLTKEEYGTYDLVTVLVSLVLPAATLQIQTAAFRFLIDIREDEEKTKEIISSIFAFILPISMFMLMILFFILPGKRFDRLLVCLYFLVDILVNSCRQIVRGLKKNLDYSISAIISAIGKMVFVVIFVWYLKTGLTGAVLALLAASSISLFVLFVRTKLYSYIDLKMIRIPVIRKMLSYSLPMVPNQLSMWVMKTSDRFVVTSVLGLSANAVYGVANKIPSILNLAQSTFTMAWHENASMASKDEDSAEYYTSMFASVFDLTAGFLGLLIGMTPLLFALLIRGDYEESLVQMPFLFLGVFFCCQSTFLGGIYVAYKDTKSVGITTMIAAAFNFAIDIILIRRIGLYAASISTMVSYILLFVFRVYDVRKLVDIRFDLKHIVIVTCVLAFESVIFYLKKPLLSMVNMLIGIVLFVLLNREKIIFLWKKGKERFF